jgi:hypothetical protein
MGQWPLLCLIASLILARTSQPSHLSRSTGYGGRAVDDLLVDLSFNLTVWPSIVPSSTVTTPLGAVRAHSVFITAHPAGAMIRMNPLSECMGFAGFPFVLNVLCLNEDNSLL